jgi:hypothetical protein
VIIYYSFLILIEDVTNSSSLTKSTNSNSTSEDSAPSTVPSPKQDRDDFDDLLDMSHRIPKKVKFNYFFVINK